MKVYCVCYTRNDFLTTFQNLPFEYKYILKELQLERMSEGEQDGFVWKTHSKTHSKTHKQNMYSCTWVHSFFDQNIDKRQIPLLVSFVMDKEAAEQILQEPSRLFSLTEKLSRTTYEEAIQFSNKEVKGTWEDVIVEERKVNGNEKNVSRLVKGMVKVFCGTENKRSCCFIDASVDDFVDALQRIPLVFRLELSFSFPYPGAGACVSNVNLVKREVLELEKKKSYDGWPVCKRFFLNESLNLTVNETRIYHEMKILYNEYEEFPFHGTSKEILDKLLLLSYVREFENKNSSESRNFLFEHKNEKELIVDLASYLKKPISNKLSDLLKATEETTTEETTSKKRVKKSYAKKKRCATANFSYRNLITVALWNLLLILIIFFFFDVHMDEKYIHITFSFEVKNLATYLLAILQGVVTSQLFMRKRGKGK